jgi:hypothetical protein
MNIRFPRWFDLSLVVLLLVLANGSFVYAAGGSSPSEASPVPGEVQERGVPSKEVIVQGNQLRAAPGYVLEKADKNRMVARQKAGGGPKLTLDCGCQGGTGSCGMEVSGDVAICHRGAVNPCSGTCGWTDVPSKVGKPQFR